MPSPNKKSNISREAILAKLKSNGTRRGTSLPKRRNTTTAQLNAAIPVKKKEGGLSLNPANTRLGKQLQSNTDYKKSVMEELGF